MNAIDKEAKRISEDPATEKLVDALLCKLWDAKCTTFEKEGCEWKSVGEMNGNIAACVANRLGEMYVIADGLCKMLDKENNALKDEIARLQKGRLPDGM